MGQCQSRLKEDHNKGEGEKQENLERERWSKEAEKQAPSVFPLIPDCKSLGSKTHVTIGCLATAFHPQPVNIKWNSGAITSGIKNFPAVKGQGELYTSSSQLTIPESDWCTKTFECNVEHTPSTTKVSKKIPGCKKSTPTVRVLQSSCDDNTRFNELVCLIYGHFPERIEVQWLQNGKAMSSQPNTTTQKLEEEGTFNTMSQVKILKEKWNPGANYTCSVTHPASQSQTTDSFRQCTDCKIIPKIVLLPPSPKDLFGTQTSKFTCMISRLSTAEDLSVKWSKSNGEKFNGNNSASMQEVDGTYSINSTLQITPEAWENNDITCSVTNRYLTTPVEEKIAKRAGTGRAPSVYILPPSVNEDPPSENKIQGFVSLTCLIKGFKPKYIEIEWFKRNKKINMDTALNEATYSNTDPTLEKDGDTYFMYSNLRIVETDWNNGSTFSCKVYHSALSRELKKEIKKSDSHVHDWYMDQDCSSEDDDDSLWTTAVTFIALFLLSMFYSATITLVKVKWCISRMLQLDAHVDNHFMAVLEPATGFHK